MKTFEFDKSFFRKSFSDKRMDRYFDLYRGNESRAILHYECNIKLAEALYVSLSVLEVSLRNALIRELETMTEREDWYAIFPTIEGLKGLNKYVVQAEAQISKRHEIATPSKIVAELTLGFWVSLLNSEYEKLLWKDLRRAFPYLPKTERKRKTVSAPLNTFRTLRNRVFHNESICWNISHVENIHANIIKVIGWINKDIPIWMRSIDRFDAVCIEIRTAMGWTR